MQTLKFGPHSIRASEIFFTSKFSFGLVNLKPIVPGHVLVIPRRLVPRVKDLTQEEAADLFVSAQAIGNVIEQEYGGESLTFAMQDGPAAGQSVPHVHIHIIPRRLGDWGNNDDIYDEISSHAKNLSKSLKDGNGNENGNGNSTAQASSTVTPHGKVEKKGVDFENRKPRSLDEMAAEAGKLRKLFQHFDDIWSQRGSDAASN